MKKVGYLAVLIMLIILPGSSSSAASGFSIEECAQERLKEKYPYFSWEKWIILSASADKVHLQAKKENCEAAKNMCKPGDAMHDCAGSQPSLWIERKGNTCEVVEEHSDWWHAWVMCPTLVPGAPISPTSTPPPTSTPEFSQTSEEAAGIVSGVGAITAGGTHTCALTDDGQVLCFGDNAHGQLGPGVPLITTLSLTATLEPFCMVPDGKWQGTQDSGALKSPLLTFEVN